MIADKNSGFRLFLPYQAQIFSTFFHDESHKLQVIGNQNETVENLSTLWCPLGFGDIRKKTPKRTWLCAGISPVRYALQTR